MSSAAIVVIGNELLNGQIQDGNVVFISRRLFQMGITLQQVTIVLDNPDDIALQVKLFSKTVDFVFTVGGLGCTLDDVTMKGVADAFNETLVFSEDLFKILNKVEKNVDPNSTNCIKGKPQTKLSESKALTKMATIPSSSVLNHRFPNQNSHYPVLSLKNVFILPGPPSAVKDQFIIIEKLIHKAGCDTFFRASAWILSDEKEISIYLDELSAKYPLLTIGSYPNDLNLEIVFTSKISNIVNAVLEEFKAKLPVSITISNSVDFFEGSGEIVDINSELIGLPCESYIPSEIFNEPEFGSKLSKSIAIIRSAIEKYGIEHTSMSFNGGKDCTVLLHLLAATLDMMNREKNCMNGTLDNRNAAIKSLYIMANDPFVEVEEFVDECVTRYNLDLQRINKPMKEGLKDYLDSQDKVKAIFIGTRRTDPYSSHLTDFNMTDGGWPEIMRIHPVLDWDYVDIWMFLRRSNIRYCMLYDQGYTSIGGTTNTLQNDKLRDPGWISGFRPAYKLLDGTKERDGRISKKTPKISE